MFKIKLSRRYLRFFAAIKTYESLFSDNSNDKDFFDEVLRMSIVDCLQVINILNLFYLHASIQHTKTEIDSCIVDNFFLQDIFGNDQLTKCFEKFGIKLKDNNDVTKLYKDFTNKLDLQQIKKMNYETSGLYLIDVICCDTKLLDVLSIEDSLFIFNKNVLVQIITNIQKNILQELMDWNFYEEKDKIFLNNLVKTAIENKNEVDELLTKYSINWSVDRFFLIDKVIINLAYNEMKHMDTPRRVAINEYINLTKMFNNDDKSSKFVNAIIDKIIAI